MKLYTGIHNIFPQESVSQISYLCLSFHVKKQVTFGNFLKLYFSDFIK